MNQAIIYTKECFIPIFYQDLLEPNMQAEKKKRSLSAPMCFTTSIPSVFRFLHLFHWYNPLNALHWPSSRTSSKARNNTAELPPGGAI